MKIDEGLSPRDCELLEEIKEKMWALFLQSPVQSPINLKDKEK